MSDIPSALGERLASFAPALAGLSVSARRSSSPPGIALVLSGSLDGGNSGDFRRLAQAGLEALAGGEALVLELDALTYVSSTGVGAFMTLLAEARRRETYLFLRGMREQVRVVFDVLGFSEFFSFLDAEG